MRGPNACSVQLLQAVQAWTLVPARHAAAPPQRLYYKMQDQRDAKGRASGTFTCQMVAAALLLSCHRGLDRQVIRGRNICHSARMVCCPISGLGTLIWKRQNTRRRTFVVNRLTLRTCELERASERAAAASAALLSLPHSHQSLNMERGGDEEISPPPPPRLRECVHTGACLINLLHPCQVTPIFLSQRKCVASRSRGKSFKEKYLSRAIYLLLPSPTQSRHFSSAS